MVIDKLSETKTSQTRNFYFFDSTKSRKNIIVFLMIDRAADSL